MKKKTRISAISLLLAVLFSLSCLTVYAAGQGQETAAGNARTSIRKQTRQNERQSGGDNNTDAGAVSVNVDAGQSLDLRSQLPASVSSGTRAWSSNNIGVAKVSAVGEVTGVAAGDCVIAASYIDSRGKARAYVIGLRVQAPGSEDGKGQQSSSKNQSRDTTGSTPEVITVGETRGLKFLWPFDASSGTLAWSSSNTEVAMVDGTGRVAGVAAGSCVIKAVRTDSGGNVQVCRINLRVQP